MLAQHTLISLGGILAAPIGMVHQTGGGHASPQRQLQRLQGQLRLQVRLHGPPDDAARVQVEHDRQIQPALPRPDEGDVGGPPLVWMVGLEVTLEHVGGDGPAVRAVGGVPDASRGQAHEPHVPQQSRDTLPPHRTALLRELLVDTRAPIGAPAGGMDGPDAYLQPVVVPRPLARQPVHPGVVPRSVSPPARGTDAARRTWPSPRESTQTSRVFLGEEGRRFF